ncbi:MAG: hypothetical protein WCC87_06365 [Candidatus Korobacteraceae bacterium]
MTGKRLLKRFVTVFLGALSFFVFLDAIESHAVEARPDVPTTFVQLRLDPVRNAAGGMRFCRDLAR